MDFSYFGQLCTEVYDITKPIGYSFGDVEFYLERLRSCKGRILELAVGTGRVMVPLLEAGLIVDGLDESVEMLESCKKSCIEKGFSPKFYNDKMQDFSLDDQYEAIIIPAGSFLIIEKREESLKALKCFYQHLRQGGRLILDILVQTDIQSNVTTTETYVTPENDVITMEYKVIEVDFLNQYSISHFRYDKWRKGKLVQSELQRSPFRWYGIEEFKMILEAVGFRDIIISAEYQHGKYPSNAGQTITFEAYRR